MPPHPPSLLKDRVFIASRGAPGRAIRANWSSYHNNFRDEDARGDDDIRIDFRRQARDGELAPDTLDRSL